MRRSQGAIRVMVMVATAALLLVKPLAYGQQQAEMSPTKESPDFSVSRAVVGTGVDNREPAGVAETFLATTEKVYCFLAAADISKNTEVSLVWYHGQDEKLKTTLPLQAGKKWRTYAYKNLRGMKGDWKVEIKDAAGNTLKEVTFKVE